MKKYTVKIIIILIMIGIIGIIFSICLNKNEQDIRIKATELKIKSIRLSNDALIGELENTLNKDMNMVYVKFIFKDKNGNIVKETSDSNEKLKKGFTWLVEVKIPDIKYKDYTYEIWYE
jgi:hypothetical protein